MDIKTVPKVSKFLSKISSHLKFTKFPSQVSKCPSQVQLIHSIYNEHGKHMSNAHAPNELTRRVYVLDWKNVEPDADEDDVASAKLWQFHRND